MFWKLVHQLFTIRPSPLKSAISDLPSAFVFPLRLDRGEGQGEVSIPLRLPPLTHHASRLTIYFCFFMPPVSTDVSPPRPEWARMKLLPTQRCYPTEHLASGSQFDQTDPDYEDHRLHRMRVEYRSLPPEWRGVYLAGLCNKDAEAVAARRIP